MEQSDGSMKVIQANGNTEFLQVVIPSTANMRTKAVFIGRTPDTWKYNSLRFWKPTLSELDVKTVCFAPNFLVIILIYQPLNKTRHNCVRTRLRWARFLSIASDCYNKVDIGDDWLKECCDKELREDILDYDKVEASIEKYLGGVVGQFIEFYCYRIKSKLKFMLIQMFLIQQRQCQQT